MQCKDVDLPQPPLGHHLIESVQCRPGQVRDAAGNYLLMELELIEPSLYLRTHEQAAARFAAAFDQRVKELS